MVTTPLLPHFDAGSPLNIIRAELADILNIAFGQTQNVVRIGTASGSTFLAYGHELTLEVIGSTLLFETMTMRTPFRDYPLNTRPTSLTSSRPTSLVTVNATRYTAESAINWITVNNLDEGATTREAA